MFKFTFVRSCNECHVPDKSLVQWTLQSDMSNLTSLGHFNMSSILLSFTISYHTGGSKSKAATSVVIIICGWGQRHSATKISERWSTVAILSCKQPQPNAYPSKELANAKPFTNELPAVVQLWWSTHQSQELCKNSITRTTARWFILQRMWSLSLISTDGMYFICISWTT